MPSILAAACCDFKEGRALVLANVLLFAVLLEMETDFKAVPVASLEGVVFSACPEEASFNEIVFLGPEDEEDEEPEEEEEEESELCQLEVSPCPRVPPDLELALLEGLELALLEGLELALLEGLELALLEGLDLVRIDTV